MLTPRPPQWARLREVNLSQAAAAGDTERVSALLKIVSRSSDDGDGSALQAAAGNGHAEVVSILLKAGFKPFNGGYGSALQAAAKNGYTEVVSIILRAGVKPSDDGYGSALQAAAGGGFVEVISILLKAGVKPLGGGASSALCTAAMNGHAEVVSILLRAGVKPSPDDGNGSALKIAAGGGHGGVVLALLKAGVGPLDDGDGTALYTAAMNGHAEVVSILLKADIRTPEKQGSALQVAAVAGDTGVISILAGAGVNINGISSTGTVLQQVAGIGNAEVIEELIAQGADPNLAAPFKKLSWDPLEGLIRARKIPSMYSAGPSILPPTGIRKTYGLASKRHVPLIETWPLCIAAGGGYAAAVRALLDLGARIDVGSPDKTAMRAAASEGHKDVVQILLDNGANINARDTQGRTCLTWGISHPEVVQFLLERGADKRLQALDGATPLHHAVRGFHVDSVSLLLDAGANFETADYNNRKPLDIVLLDSNPSPVSIKLVKLFLEHGCDVGRRGISSWRTILEANNTDIVEITGIPEVGHGNDPSGAVIHEKSGITVALIRPSQDPPSFNISDNPELLSTRKLYSASGAQILFPVLDVSGTLTCTFSKQDALKTGSVIEWQWFQLDEFGAPSGYGLSNVERLAATTDKQALLSCYVCFEWFHFPETESLKTLDLSAQRLGKAFRAQLQKSEIFWIMRKPCISPDTRTSYEGRTVASSNPIFRSEDFRSTLDIGWIPDSGVDFFTLFILELHKKWRTLLEQADLHLTKNRKTLLQKKGKTGDFIDNLLFDAQQWSNFRALLRIHVQNARDLAEDFEEKQFLCEEIGYEKSQQNPERSATEIAVDKLSETITRMESEVEDEIKKLDVKIKEMIELEFNLVSIYEARTSKIMGMSMKRLSWITFIFLPLMFVASLFGMNVDVVNGSGPRWWWVIALSAVLFAIVMLTWGLLKIIRADEEQDEEQDEDVTIARKLEALSRDFGRGWRKRVGRFSDDLKSEKVASGAYEFKPPPRRWAKLKEL